MTKQVYLEREKSWRIETQCMIKNAREGDSFRENGEGNCHLGGDMGTETWETEQVGEEHSR